MTKPVTYFRNLKRSGKTRNSDCSISILMNTEFSASPSCGIKRNTSLIVRNELLATLEMPLATVSLEQILRSEFGSKNRRYYRRRPSSIPSYQNNRCLHPDFGKENPPR